MQRKVSRISNLLVIFALILSCMQVGALAADSSSRMTGISSLSADLIIYSSGRSESFGYVSTYPGYSVDLTVSLKQDGETIKSWSESGSGKIQIDEPYYVTPNHDYQVTATAVVKNSSGVTVDKQTTDSVIVSY